MTYEIIKVAKETLEELIDLRIGDDDLKNMCLIEIEMLLQENGRSLTDFKSMPMANTEDMPTFKKKIIVDELNYNKDKREKTHADMLLMIADEQRCVHDKIMESVDFDDDGFFFIYGYSGTGKIFIWKTLSVAVRSKGLIVLNVASSGISTLLLPGGRTVHSTLTVPVEINEASSLKMEKDSPRQTWCMLQIDQSMHDIISKNDPLYEFRPFGGMTVVLSGDFRHILSVVRKGTRQDIVDASINSSKIWTYCNVLRLTVNMRLGASSGPAEKEETDNFGKWIPSIGEDNDENGEMNVEIPEDLLISDTTNPLMSLIDFVYPDLNDNIGDPLFFPRKGNTRTNA
ncbi:PIF1-like helicase [Medicago truncatula]|uniref:ATP-dependent DNA helicase n=1 Tax=Medicago truncatula TaxID=3880 RepID=A0A072UW45_MEDTR|nr:PIF1-like helicase [Medicago truncatula]